MIAFLCDTRIMDTIDEIALILARPSEGELLGGRGKKTTASKLQKLMADRHRQVADRLRAGLAQAGPSADSLLTTLSSLRRQRLEAEMTNRLLVAYGREFVRPRPYRLVDLAEAAGMSISGIRTVYGDDEINQVAKALERDPNPRQLPGE